MTNVALCAFLHYPITSWIRGFLQVANTIIFSIRMGKIRGLVQGIASIPIDCYRNRRYRNPISHASLRQYLRFRKTGVLEASELANDA